VQEEQVAAKAKAAVLPPLQSLLDLTSAAQPPTRGESEARPMSEVAASMGEGKGMLEDGTK
jgi:hypothetical protein